MRVWDVTNPDLVTDDMWKEMYDVYIEDKHDLDVTEFLEATNPYAAQSMRATMLESGRTGYWNPSDEVMQNLVKEYVESVAKNGVACCHHTCGNILNGEYVQSLAIKYGVSDTKIDKFNEIMYEATEQETFAVTASDLRIQYEETPPEKPDEKYVEKKSGNSVTHSMASSSLSNETEASTASMGQDMDLNPRDVAKSTTDDYVEGYEMTKESIEQKPEPSPMQVSGGDIIGMVLVFSLLGIIFVGFKRRKI